MGDEYRDKYGSFYVKEKNNSLMKVQKVLVFL